MTTDELLFFNKSGSALPIYERLSRLIGENLPETTIKVAKTQISFFCRNMFAAVSLPRKKSQPGIIVSFGLSYQRVSPRISLAVEPYPNRWTHHVAVETCAEIDGELLDWLKEAYEFARIK